MDIKDISAVLLKTSGLVMLAFAAFEIPSYFLPRASDYEISVLTAVVQAAAMLSLPIVLGLLLWFFPATVTNKMVSGPKLSGEHFGASDFERVALTVVGAWLVAYGIADLIYTVSSMVVVQRLYAEESAPLGRYIPSVITNLAKVALGLGLALGAKGITRVISRIRGEG